MRSSNNARTGELPLIPGNSGNQVNTSNLNLTYDTSTNRKIKMNNTNNRTNSRNTSSRAGYLDFNDHYLDHYTSSNDHHLPHQYQYNNYLNNDNLGVDRLDYLNSNNVYGHSMHPAMNLAQARQLQEDDCKSIHQYEEPMNLMRPLPANFSSIKNNSLINSLNRKYSDLHLNHQQDSLHLEMASRKENSENSDESVLSMESDMSDKRNLMRKNGANSSSSGSNNGQSSVQSHVYNGRIGNTNSRKFTADGKDHLSELPNSSDCSLSKSNIDTVSSTVPGSSTATLEADARFMNLISNGSKYNKNTSIINYDNERIYGLSSSKLSNNPLDCLNYGGNMAEENIYNNGSAASTTSASNILLKTGTLSSSKYNVGSTLNHTNGSNLTGNGINLLNDLRNKSATLQAGNNANQLNLFKHDSGTTGPLMPSQNTTNLLTSQLLDQTGTVYHTALHSNFDQQNPAFKMLNSRFSFSLTKSCNSNQPCYWRLASLILIFVCLLLVALFAYKQATNSALLFNDNSNKPCILVDDYSMNGQVPIFPPPQFLPKQQIQPNLPSYSSSPTGSTNSGFSSSSIANSANPSTTQNYPSSSSNTNVHSIHLPTDPSTYKELEFNTDYSSNLPSDNLNSQTAYLIESIALNSVIAGKFQQKSGGLIRFKLKQLPVWTRLAFFARRTEPPTLTNHELVEFITADGSTNPQRTSKRRSSRSVFEQIIFKGTLNSLTDELTLSENQNNRIKRSSLNSISSGGSTISIEYLEYFEPGQWFFVFINDANHEQQYTVHMNITKLISTQYSCPNDCNGHGTCEQGKCNCDTGFIGTDCGRNVCPVLCSGNGQYSRGSCKCDAGFYGVECENKRSFTCAQSDLPCSGHGLCIAGHCMCNKNYEGDNCEQLIDTTCKSNQVTSNSLSNHDSELIKETNQKQKELEVCLAHCMNGRCNDKGKCICSIGYSGRFCTLSACANNCSSHGQCVPIRVDQSTTNIVAGENEYDLENDQSIEYQCSCSADWTGPDCSFRFERNCADDEDNDNDGLIDCADSECCAKDECKDSLMCLSSVDPLDIVLRKPAPSISASFYQKTKFLIEEGSVQSYAHRDEYSESEFWNAFDASRVSVIRGKIVTPDGNGLTGIRISVATDPQFGFTLTRPDGWWDILVNGGSMVTIQFQRSPFHPIKHSVYVGWNEIVVMQSPIVMSVVANTDDTQQHNQSGSQHSTSISSHGLNRNNSNYLHQYTLETVFWPYTTKSLTHQRNKQNEQQVKQAIVGRNHRPIVSNNNNSSSTSSFSLHCWSHDYRMQPLIINRQNKISKQGNLYDQSSITLEDRSIAESYKIAGSNLQLVYQSSSSSAYLSVVELQLTPDKIPHDLLLVHLRIVIEGNLFSKELEAKASQTYSYAWNKRNVYKQKVYGVATAKIYVGYEYEHCQHIIWSTLSTKMNGFQIDVSELANWNLQIHHRLNLNEKIIQLGSGGSINLQQDVYLKETFGKYGQMRKDNDCLDSKVPNENCQLLRQPVGLTSGSDGSLYFGDADLIRRLKPDGTSSIIFKFPTKSINNQSKKNSQAYVYYLQFSAYDNHLYVTDSERFQIFKLLSLDNVEQPENNFEIIAGNGLRCLHSEDADQCGDGGLAIEARLSHPKSIVFSSDNSMYFSDGTSVRRINRRGVIYTIVSASLNNHKLKPFNCDYLNNEIDLKLSSLLHSPSRLSARKIKLNWPTQLAINPLNNLLYILDEGHVVYELTADHRLRVVVGRPAHCSNVNDLGLITSFVFTSTGDMYLSLISNNGLHQIKLRTTDGTLQHYLGEQLSEKLNINLDDEQHHFEEHFLHNYRDELKLDSFINYYDQLLNVHLSDCLANLDDDQCQAYVNYENLIYLNRTARSRKSTKQFKVNAITVTGDNLLHLIDSENYQLLSVKLNLDEEKQQNFNILNSLTDELYLFNKYGLHLATLNALTGKTIYTFTYDQNNSLGKLISVTDSSNNKINFIRQQGKLTAIVSANGQKCKVNINAKGQLEQIVEEDGLKTIYEYDANNLLVAKSDNLGFNYHYEYDRFGRLLSVIKPSGARVDLNYRSSVEGALIQTKEINLVNEKVSKKLQLQFKPNGKHQHLYTNAVELSLSDLTNSNYLISNSFNQTVHLGRIPAQELITFQPANSAIQSHTIKQIIYNRLPTGEMRRTQISWEIDIKYKANREDTWRQDEIVAVERVLNIEGNRILSIEYDRTANREIMYNNSRRPFLMIQYETNSSRPIQWLNTETRLPLNVIYDRQGRLAGWQQGSKMSETFVYDRNGLLSEIKYPDSSSIKYMYEEEFRKHSSSEQQLPTNLKPTKIILRSGKEFFYKYDQKAGLKEIWTPKSSIKHQFKFIISLGFYKLQYAAPGYDFSNAYTVYFNDELKPIIEQNSNSNSKVLFRYNEQNGRLTEIVYGGGKVVHSYEEDTNNRQLLMNEYWLEGDDQVLISYTYKYSRLPSTQQIQFNTMYKLFDFRYQYEYDSFNRKTSIRSSIVNNSETNGYVNSLNYIYNEKTGKLEQFGHFKIVDHHDYLRKQNESLISDGIATFSKIYDSINHKLKQFSLNIRDREVYRTIYTLNSNNAIVSKKRFVKINGQHNLRSSQTNFTYDLDEQLIEMKSEREHWRFSYDDNFNLIRIQYLQNAIEITIDHVKDRISNFGDTPYIYDEQGYLIRRGEELFTYNTLGLLVSINKLTKQHEINYLYDSRGRLSARIDDFGNRTQYIYGDIKRPHLLTHLIQFNVDRSSNELQSQSRPLITSYIYDDSNLLIAFTTTIPNLSNLPSTNDATNKQLFYIVCDQSGSPTHVFNSQTGELVKEITRSPFGHILFDSNPSIYLPIGFHAAISEPLISIVFFGRFVYDTLVGQFLQPNYGQILNAGVIEPKYLSLYRYARNDPINLDLYSLTRTDRYDLNKWIQHNGIDLSGFDLELSRFINQNDQHFSKLLTSVEDVVYNYRRSGVQRKQIPCFNYGSSEQFDALSYTVNMIADALPLPNLALNSDFLSTLTLNSMNFAKISFIKKSQLKSDQLLEPSKIERLHTIQTPLGDGLSLSRKRNGNLYVTTTLDADQLKYTVYSKVLNESELINLQQSREGKDLFYFVKSDTVSVSEDLSELQKFGHSVNITINEVKSEQTDSDTKSKVDIRIETSSSIMNIRYGSTLKEEHRRLLNTMKQQAIKNRWKQIQQTLLDSKLIQDQFSTHRSSSKLRARWSEKEKERIITNGELTGYIGEYYHDVKHYPELADDASNIIFIKN